MELKLDIEKFDEIQQAFIREITEDIHTKLVEAGLEGLTLENTTALIAYSMASIIDDTSNIEIDGVQARPYLTFREGDDTLIHCGENSYTYEYVTDNLKRMYES